MQTWDALIANPKLGWIFGAFVFYLILIAVFAFIYWLVHLMRPEWFFFAKEIQAAQKERRLFELSDRLNGLRRAFRCLSEAHERMRAEPDGALPNLWVQSTGTITIESDVIPHAHAGGIYVHQIALYEHAEGKSSNRRLIDCWEYTVEPFVTIRDLEQTIRNRLGGVEHEVAKINALSDSIESGSSRYLWPFVDFFYFSTMIQSTAGSGDIQPNSPFVRIVVTAQVLVGLFILAVLINIFPESPVKGS